MIKKRALNNYRELTLRACDNANNALKDYSNHLSTLAGLILGLFPLLLSLNALKDLGYVSKTTLIISLGLVFLSLVIALINNLREKMFYEKWSGLYTRIYTKWEDCKEIVDEKHTESFEKSIYNENKTCTSSVLSIVQGSLVLGGLMGIVSIMILLIVKL